MGSFRNIASSNDKSNEPVEKFKIGLAVSSKEQIGVPPFCLKATFSEQGSQPAISSLYFHFDEHSFLEMRRGDTDTTIMAIPGFQEQVDISFSESIFLLALLIASGVKEKSFATSELFPNFRHPDMVDQLL